MSAEALKEKKGFTHIPFLHNPKISLLKSAAIYGHNSFGKSNLLKAYVSFQQTILNSFTIGNIAYETSIEPFRLNTTTLNKPSFFEAIFIIKQTKYRYGFEIYEKKVVSEWLYYTDGVSREHTLYIRVGQDYGEISKLWLKNTGNKVHEAKVFTKSNNLFLSTLLSQEGILRIDDIAGWFKGNLILNGNYGLTPNNSAVQIYSNEEYRNIILKFLDNADLGFKSVFEKVSRYINEKGYHTDLINTVFDTKQANFDLYTQHKIYDDNYKIQRTIEFDLIKNESSGSIKYFILACYLAYALKRGQLIWIDEIDASLSTQLLTFLLEIFNDDKNNVCGGQLIFIAHNTALLDNKLRRDQIWLVDKNEFGESTLHKGHTPETPIRINKSIEQDYREGKLARGVSKKVSKDNLPSLFDNLPPTE
ncbi:AAA family ATPase [Chitinophaga ginsengisoli]|nr:ATP-binding protein [Chitinophaga ginsengisoli]